MKTGYLGSMCLGTKSWEESGVTLYDYGFRIYNPGIARFLSVDPLAPEYPYYTPYQFAGNMPIAAIDLDGLEPYVVVAEDGTEYKSSLEQPVVVVLENKFQLLQRMVMGNRFQDWQPMGCGCGLSSNVPTNGVTGYASGLVDITAAAALGTLGATVLAPVIAPTLFEGTVAAAPYVSQGVSFTGRALWAGRYSFSTDFLIQASMNGIQQKNILANYNFVSGAASIISPFGRSLSVGPLSFGKSALNGTFNGALGGA